MNCSPNCLARFSDGLAQLDNANFCLAHRALQTSHLSPVLTFRCRTLLSEFLRSYFRWHPATFVRYSFCSFLNLTICNIIRIGPAGMAFRPCPEAISVLACAFAQEAAVASCRCQQACCRRRRSVGMRLRLRMPWRRRRRRRDRLSRHRCRELRAM